MTSGRVSGMVNMVNGPRGIIPIAGLLEQFQVCDLSIKWESIGDYTTLQ